MVHHRKLEELSRLAAGPENFNHKVLLVRNREGQVAGRGMEVLRLRLYFQNKETTAAQGRLVMVTPVMVAAVRVQLVGLQHLTSTAELGEMGHLTQSRVLL
jgi:hypothetical protein